MRILFRCVLAPLCMLATVACSDSLAVENLDNPDVERVYKAGEPESDLDRFVTTDASGNATVTLDGPGEYILVARHRANAPAGSAAQIQSFTTSLVFEAHETLPAVVQLPQAAEDPSPRRRSRIRR